MARVPEWRPHVWKILTGVLAVAVIGLAIWAIGLSRDEDDGAAPSTAQVEDLES